MTAASKEDIKHQLVVCLSASREVRRIVIFGSFLSDADPHDLDVAVFQDSREGYLPLAMKYRRMARVVADRIPLDIVPIRTGASPGAFLAEIERGEVIYER